MKGKPESIIKKLQKNVLSAGGFIFVFLVIVLAILGYLITPDKTPNANRQIVEIAALRPCSQITFIKVHKNEKPGHTGILKTMIQGRKDYYTFIPVDSFNLSVNKLNYYVYSHNIDEVNLQNTDLVHVLYPVDVYSDIIYNDDKCSFTHLSEGKKEVSLLEMKKEFFKNNVIKKRFVLGTDRYGRDLLSRMIVGSRISLSVGFMAVLISLVIGIVLGLVSGYFYGWVDKVIMFFVNVMWSVPALLLALALTIVMGKGYWQLFLAIGLSMWVEVARIVRGQVLSIKEKEFVLATRVLGFSNLRILFKHILPNIVNPVIIVCAANFSTAILLEAGLSFLGIGIQPPIPSWGGIIRDHYGYIIVDLAYLAIVPGIAIILLVLSFTFIGNGLRDAFDQKG